MIVTYKYYDSKKRRLAISARPLDDNFVLITTIACSRKDDFSKKYASRALNSLAAGKKGVIYERITKTSGKEVEVHPNFYNIDISTSWKKDTMEWLNLNFYRHAVRRGFTTEEILVKSGSKTLLVSRKVHHKL